MPLCVVINDVHVMAVRWFWQCSSILRVRVQTKNTHQTQKNRAILETFRNFATKFQLIGPVIVTQISENFTYSPRRPAIASSIFSSPDHRQLRICLTNTKYAHYTYCVRFQCIHTQRHIHTNTSMLPESVRIVVR